MKIYKLVILNFMVISFLVSCKQEKKDTKTQIQISKKIENEKRWSQEKANQWGKKSSLVEGSKFKS